MRRSIAVLSLLLLSAPAFAQFEGVIKMKMTSEQANGDITVYISKNGVLNDMDMKTAEMPMKMSMLVKSDSPGKAYHINDAAKTYSEIDLKKTQGAAKHADEAYTLKDLGQETLHGYSCRHVLLTSKRDGETELWTTREIMDYDSFANVMGPRSSIKSSFDKSLKDAGADGFPVKSIQRNGKETVTVELVDVQKKSLPASKFQIPAGYTKQEGFGGMHGAPSGAGTMPPDAQKSMDDAMKNMTPEQRQMMEKMMKH